jgi:hypothetical protein
MPEPNVDYQQNLTGDRYGLVTFNLHTNAFEGITTALH